MKPMVLLIEDNAHNRYLLTYLLEQNGYGVIAAEDGIRGLQLAMELEPDLILLDIQLPVMDGYMVARELRGNQALRTIPIVAVTSYAMTGDREKSIAAGCNGYIEKPINPDTFVAEIQQFLAPGPRSAVAP